MKILLIRNDNIGDLINTTPAIEALRKKYKDAKIDIVVNSYNYIAIDNNPFVDQIWVYTKPKHKKNILDKIEGLISKVKVFYNVFKEKYDVAIVFRSGYSPSAEQFSNISMAKMRIGVRGKGDNFTHHIEVRKNHEVEFCFDCLKPLDVEYNGEKTFFWINEADSKKYVEFKDYILFHISSRVKENKISKEKFKKIFDDLDKNIIISAEPSDIENALWLEKNTNAKFIKTKSLYDLACLIKNVKLFVSLDGGALHIGPALGVKTIGLYGKTNITRWYPWGYKDLALQDKSKIAENIDNRLIIEKIKENV